MANIQSIKSDGERVLGGALASLTYYFQTPVQNANQHSQRGAAYRKKVLKGEQTVRDQEIGSQANEKRQGGQG